MKRTTLVTLKARSQAFRMAQGVLHSGNAETIHQERCRGCRKMFDVHEGDEPSFYCPACAEKFSHETLVCVVCGRQIEPMPGAFPRVCLTCQNTPPAVKARLYLPLTREAYRQLIQYLVILLILLAEAVAVAIFYGG